MKGDVVRRVYEWWRPNPEFQHNAQEFLEMVRKELPNMKPENRDRMTELVKAHVVRYYEAYHRQRVPDDFKRNYSAFVEEKDRLTRIDRANEVAKGIGPANEETIRKAIDNSKGVGAEFAPEYNAAEPQKSEQEQQVANGFGF
jgi:hypothetical protein